MLPQELWPTGPRILKYVEAEAETEGLTLNLEPYRTFLALIGEEGKCHTAIWVSRNMAVPGQELFIKREKNQIRSWNKNSS